MLKRLARSTQTPWICQRCLDLSRRQRRFNTTVASAATTRDTPPPPSSLYGLSASEKTDDDALRNVFDNASFWDTFKRASQANKPAGIIGNQYLTHPEGFVDFVTVTIQRCNAVVQKVSAAQTIDEFKHMVKDLDKLSDLLCRVIDLADFIRGTHPDRKFQVMAVKAYHTVFQYMNQLNTTPVLYDQLKRGSEIAEVHDAWSEEERIVARILMEDFARFGIGLDEKTRERLVDLSGEIAEVGSQFVEGMAPEKSSLKFNSKSLKGLDPNLAKSLTRWGETRISTMHQEAQAVLRFVEDPEVRRETYIATRTAGKSSISRLEKMLKLRAELAQLSGYETFAHMTLENKLARTPEAVNTFLKALYEDSRPAVLADLDELMELKRGDAHQDNYPDRINAWDKFYYTQKMLSSLESYKQRTPDSLSAYFSVGTVLQGISRLFDRLYGVRFVPKETQPGEVWDDGVRRLDVISDTEGHIAVLYCDLYSRPGKTPNPAHFTLRCSREILSSEIEEMSHMQHRFSSPIEAATDGMPVSYNPTRNSYFQLPTIALICDFTTPSHTSRPTLLNIHDVRTLFHEMGHALHSILGRTALQNVSGTRCATDIAELPSVLMEHFAFDPDVLSLYARHWSTDAPLPLGLLSARLALDARNAQSELESQIILCLLDQTYHSALPLSPAFNSTKVYHETYNAYASVPEPAGTAWQGFFGHLFGYGATYYSYLFDRALAGRIWGEVFGSGVEGKGLRRENGERYKEEVLRWGGGRDGWECLAGVLGDDRLKEGGERAMREVGRWGIKEGKGM